MPSGQKRGSRGFHLFGLVLTVVAVAAVVIVAIFFRPGAFSVVAEGQGASIKLNFANSRVNLNEVLEKLLEESGSGADAEAKRRLVLSILQAHHLYRVPSVEAVMAMRGIEETETTRDAVRAMRERERPFSRPSRHSRPRTGRTTTARSSLASFRISCGAGSKGRHSRRAQAPAASRCQ